MKKIKTLCLVDDDDIFQLITQRVIAQTNLVDTIKVFSNGLDRHGFPEISRSKCCSVT
jgi:hypothetical protein